MWLWLQGNVTKWTRPPSVCWTNVRRVVLTNILRNISQFSHSLLFCFSSTPLIRVQKVNLYPSREKNSVAVFFWIFILCWHSLLNSFDKFVLLPTKDLATPYVFRFLLASNIEPQSPTASGKTEYVIDVSSVSFVKERSCTRNYSWNGQSRPKSLSTLRQLLSQDRGTDTNGSKEA